MVAGGGKGRGGFEMEERSVWRGGDTPLRIKQEEDWKSTDGLSNLMVTRKSIESHFVRWLFVKIDGTKGQNKMCLQRS